MAAYQAHDSAETSLSQSTCAAFAIALLLFGVAITQLQGHNPTRFDVQAEPRGNWIRHEKCQYREKTYELLADQWCLVVTENKVQKCLDKCHLTAGCEAVNLVPLENPEAVIFKEDINIPDSPECNTALLKTALGPEVDVTTLKVCYGFKLSLDYDTGSVGAGSTPKDRFEAKRESHRVDRDPGDPVAYSTCYRFQDAAELEVLAQDTKTHVNADPDRLWTPSELKQYGPSRRQNTQIFIACMGEVFDVTRGKQHYGKNAGYSIFSGRDASRAFVWRRESHGSGHFTEVGATDDLEDLAPSELLQVANWLEFYRKEYIAVGKLVGRYFDDEGVSTVESARVFFEAGQQAKEHPPKGARHRNGPPIPDS